MAGALLEKAGDRHFTWGYLGHRHGCHGPFSWQKGWMKMDINCDIKRKRDICIYIYIYIHIHICIYIYVSQEHKRAILTLVEFELAKGAEFHWAHDFDHLEGSTGFQFSDW